MNEKEVVELLKNAERMSVDVWIDGGWGVDALLGRQTRPHDDLDVFVQKKDAKAFTEMLNANGFREVETEYTAADHTCWRTADNRVVDLHLFEFTEAGTLSFNNEIYPSNVLSGKGTIGIMAVRCLTVEAQILYHQGYERKEKDAHDVLLLCDAFGLSIPAGFER